MFTRYAIYYTPAPDTPLAAFGAEWLGWDSSAGAVCKQPDVAGLDIIAVTETPRKYGFHGTIKPPFRLADGHSLDQLQDALDAMCGDAAPAALQGLELSRLGRFLALVPTGDSSALGALAARVVQELDMFRDPPTDAELIKRRAARLSAAQDAHLERWGYPYVLDQFRFHLTLTGKLDKATAQMTEAALTRRLSKLTLAPYRIAALTLLGEAETGMFHQIHRYALTG